MQQDLDVIVMLEVDDCPHNRPFLILELLVIEGDPSSLGIIFHPKAVKDETAEGGQIDPVSGCKVADLVAMSAVQGRKAEHEDVVTGTSGHDRDAGAIDQGVIATAADRSLYARQSIDIGFDPGRTTYMKIDGDAGPCCRGIIGVGSKTTVKAVIAIRGGVPRPAGKHQEGVVAVVTFNHIIAVAADKNVIALAALQLVMAVTAMQDIAAAVAVQPIVSPGRRE
jgi:hypothetical protein